jgi:hypothetical protein
MVTLQNKIFATLIIVFLPFATECLAGLNLNVADSTEASTENNRACSADEGDGRLSPIIHHRVFRQSREIQRFAQKVFINPHFIFSPLVARSSPFLNPSNPIRVDLTTTVLRV